MSDKKTIAQFEEEKGMMFLDLTGINLKHKVTEEEFGELAATDNYKNVRGVAFDERKEWLSNNGYELTRANMLNPELPTVQPE